MNDRKNKNNKLSLPQIPTPNSSVNSQKAEKIAKATDLNPEAVVSALRKWLTEDKK